MQLEVWLASELDVSLAHHILACVIGLYLIFSPNSQVELFIISEFAPEALIADLNWTGDPVSITPEKQTIPPVSERISATQPRILVSYETCPLTTLQKLTLRTLVEPQLAIGHAGNWRCTASESFCGER